MTPGRRALTGLVAALALLGAAATAQGAEITLAGPRQDAIIATQPGRVIQLPLSWRVDFAGCSAPTSQTVTVTRLSGATTLIRNPPVLTPPNAAVGRSVLLVPAVTVVSRQRWTVTLTCATSPTVRASGVFVLAPQNAPAVLRGRYVLGRQDVWRAGGRCIGTTCLAQVRSALQGRTFNPRSTSGFPYRASVNGAFSCRGRGGRVVRNAGRGQLGLTVTVLTVRAVGTAIVAQRIQVRGFLRLLRRARPAARARRALRGPRAHPARPARPALRARPAPPGQRVRPEPRTTSGSRAPRSPRRANRPRPGRSTAPVAARSSAAGSCVTEARPQATSTCSRARRLPTCGGRWWSSTTTRASARTSRSSRSAPT